jgi:lipopolysaccharide exporter
MNWAGCRNRTPILEELLVPGTPWAALKRITRFLRSEEGGISARVFRGTVWVFSMRIALTVIGLMRSIILARMLAPEDFGLMGMVGLATAILVVLSQTGTWTAIIQRDELSSDVLHTGWLIQAARGLILAAFIALLANPVANFFDSAALTPVLRVMALSFIFKGFNSMGLVLLERQMAYKTLTYYSLSVAVANLIAASIGAFLWRSVWALVAGELVGGLIGLFFSFAIHEYRPRWEFNRDKAHELWAFGRYINANGIVSYLTTQGDDGYVGKILGSEALGFYGMAYRASNLPMTAISELISRVTLPAYAAVKSDLSHLRQLYLNALTITALLAFPVTSLLFALAPYWVATLYGNRWLPLVPSSMVLCVYGLERAIGSVAGHVFVVMGHPKLAFQLNLGKLAVMALVIIPLTQGLGILGTSIAVTISAVAVQAAVIPVTSHYLQVPIREVLNPMVRPALGSALLISLIYGLRTAFDWPAEFSSLLLLSMIGILAYGLVIIVSNQKLSQMVWMLVHHLYE